VEVCHDRSWGTVCDDNWSNRAGKIACQQLGFAYVTAFSRAAFGEGTGPIWLYDLSCTGLETRLINCSYAGIIGHICRHSEDAGLRCAGKSMVFVCFLHV